MVLSTVRRFRRFHENKSNTVHEIPGGQHDVLVGFFRKDSVQPVRGLYLHAGEEFFFWVRFYLLLHRAVAKALTQIIVKPGNGRKTIRLKIQIIFRTAASAQTFSLPFNNGEDRFLAKAPAIWWIIC